MDELIEKLNESESNLRRFMKEHPEETIGDRYNIKNRLLYIELDRLYNEWMHDFLLLLNHADTYNIDIRTSPTAGTYSNEMFELDKNGIKLAAKYGDFSALKSAYILFSKPEELLKTIDIDINEQTKKRDNNQKILENLVKLNPYFALDDL